MRLSEGALADGLQLLALFGIAFGVPLLEVLARNPGFLIGHGTTASDLVWLALGLTLLPAAAAWLVARALTRVGEPLRRGFLRVVVGVLTACFVLPVLGRAPHVPGFAALLAASLIGAGAAALFARRSGVRSFVASLAVLPALAVPAFFASGGVSRLLAPRPEVDGLAADPAAPPVVFVILDELPLISLLDEERRIDGDRYPSFAALARHATWFPRATTVSVTTLDGVPAILTGNLPRRGAIATYADHPRNLFSLLARSHRQVVHEPQTVLYSGDAGALDEVRRDPRLRFRLLLADLPILYLHRLLPADLTGGLPEIGEGWKNFEDPTIDDLREISETNFVDRAGQFERFIERIEPCQQPCLYFLHSLLPHAPWQYTEEGEKYYWRECAGQDEQRWVGLEWPVIQGYQRHLVQLALVDRLLGELLERLRAAALYDRSLIVVVADHGASFWPGESRRRVKETSHAEDILNVPLFIKAPHQRQARRVERRVETIDILPTVAQLLGTPLPWSVDGCSGLDPSCPDRPQLRVFNYDQSRSEVDPALLERSASLRRKLSLFGTGPGTAGIFEPGPWRALVGRRIEELGAIVSSPFTVQVARQSVGLALSRPGEFTARRIVGRFAAPKPLGKRVRVAIALDGDILAVVPAFPRLAGNCAVSALLPAFGGDPRNLALFLVRGSPEEPVLSRVAITPSPARR